MIAYHSVPVICDAYRKGFRGFDAELAFQAMTNSAMNSRNCQGEFQQYGHVLAVAGKRKQAASRTLEMAYDDSCIALMAQGLGKAEEAKDFNRRSQSYTNVWDPESGFFRGKTADEKFLEPFDPKAVNFDDYTEANAWQYAFAIQNDPQGMIQLYGGNEKFCAKLDRLFDQDSDVGNYLVDVSGLIGQYSHGNEPCHHIAYLYDLAGAPYKTQQRVRQIQLMLYDNSPEGICGNDDCGQMSAWYVWSAIGLYPLNPVNGLYVIGSPLIEKAVIRLDPKFYPGGKFTILAHNASRQNCYIQSAKLNGKPLNSPWITHAVIAQGGTLELEMGIQPNTAWGNGQYTGK
jgi:predicted alpha-1,2-mannosidase